MLTNRSNEAIQPMFVFCAWLVKTKTNRTGVQCIDIFCLKMYLIHAQSPHSSSSSTDVFENRRSTAMFPRMNRSRRCFQTPSTWFPLIAVAAPDYTKHQSCRVFPTTTTPAVTTSTNTCIWSNVCYFYKTVRI